MDDRFSEVWTVRCSSVDCLAAETNRTYPSPTVAVQAWNRRTVAPVRPTSAPVAMGFTNRALIEGEMVVLMLRENGSLWSNAIEFSPASTRLMARPA